MSLTAKIFIFWDFQNVNLQSLKRLDQVTAAILRKADSSGKIAGQYIYGDVLSTHKRALQKRNMLVKHGFTYVEVTSVDKNAADYRLSFDVLKAIGIHNNSHLFLLAGDSDYVPLVRVLQRAGVKITAIAKKKSASTKLLKLVDQFYSIQDLIDSKEVA